MCGKRGKHFCPEPVRQGKIARARRLLEAQAPGYSAGLSEDQLLQIGQTVRGQPTIPLPSVRFPGLLAALDQRLRDHHLDTAVSMCEAIARLDKDDQRDYLELYLKDPDDAARWASLPSWKRMLRKGDAEDQLIWKFFVSFQLTLALLAKPEGSIDTRGPRQSLPSIGAELRVWAGLLQRLPDTQKLSAFLSVYGTFLKRNEPTDLTTTPWQR
jgi:hypothetical protein